MKKVFVAGATGVLGRRVVKLLKGSFEVIGSSRSDSNDQMLEALGVRGVRMDLFNEQSVLNATRGVDYILHLATAIPKKAVPKREDWLLNDRIRTEGTKNLLQAAAIHQVDLYVQQSVAFLYGDHGGAAVDEQTPVKPPSIDVLESASTMEALVKDGISKGLPAVILRFGAFYSDDSDSTIRLLEEVRSGRMPLIAGGAGLWNPIHVDDAADAVVRAVMNAPVAAGQVYNVVDDKPLSYKDALTFLASNLGAPRPKNIPAWLAKWVAGRDAVQLFSAQTRCVNSRLKAELGWRPKYPTYLDGFAQMLK